MASDIKQRQSRSKVFGQGVVDDQEIQVTKRVKLSSDVRERRIEEVQSDIETDKDTIMLLEKEKQKCASMSKFGRAAEINEQILHHRKSMRGNQQIWQVSKKQRHVLRSTTETQRQQKKLRGKNQKRKHRRSKRQ